MHRRCIDNATYSVLSRFSLILISGVCSVVFDFISTVLSRRLCLCVCVCVCVCVCDLNSECGDVRSEHEKRSEQKNGERGARACVKAKRAEEWRKRCACVCQREVTVQQLRSDSVTIAHQLDGKSTAIF
jgi:hypothetical protein